MALSAVPSPGPLSRFGSGVEADDVLMGVQAFAATNSSGTSSMSGTGVGTPAVSRNLFVGNLPFHIQWQDLKDLFRQAGAVSRADVALGADGRSRGFGTVSFSNEADAERAVRMFNGYDYNGRPLKVHFDKFSAPATSAALAVAVPSPHSLSTPQSPFPHPHAYSVHGRPVPLAQQILQRSHSDLVHYRTGYEGVQAAGAGDGAPGMRQSPVDAEFAAVHMQARFVQLQGPAVGFEGLRVGQEQQQQQQQQQQQHPYQAMQPMPEPYPQHQHQHQHQQQHQQQHPTHIAMPFPPPYTFEFLSSGPNSPYDIYDMSAGAGAGFGWGPGGGGARYDFGPSAEQAQALQPSASGFSTLANASGSEEQVAGMIGLGGERSAVEAAVIRERDAVAGEGEREREEEVYRMPQQPSSQTQPRLQEQTTTTSPESNQPHSNSAHAHPAHPGPIALPPPPPASAFPVPPPHTLSPHFFSPASPLHHPAHALMMGMGVAMTPHGLPPITPSMPSFTFLPQPSPASGSASAGAPAAPSSASASASASVQGEQGPAPRAMMHVMSPYTPFSPGVTMSPGALWGHPGSGAVNPFLNPAVGAPVHGHAGSPGGYGYYWAAQGSGSGEPQGYFPPVPVSMAMAQGQGQGQEYFPPVLPSANGNANARSSGLANELHADSGESASSASATGVPVVGVQRAGSDPGEMARVGLGIGVPERGSR
ncbi:uncharacterized protein LAESUDRAFT_732245 [Laetiporus sulphureus 93-53]|uniref:RRM domain-containing protein n=1 Tax=Laetiporus sulphureus 93-53 TaxID=1314785 RepID=A0A165B8Y9_9APHY|nr:uncharacterized protein LAESUDRAFT_732245 [Laetiporus sulphureus 93-53]KZT00518.1 hypothetical protein LAESUDRAFT_732245 [Laetiporus sulphureus 93-53]